MKSNIACHRLLLLFLLPICGAAEPTRGETPRKIKDKHGDALARVHRSCPIIYDNDWWKDVPDAAYLWAKASLGDADLRGNIVSRDMWEWREGYKFKMSDCMGEAADLFSRAQAVGFEGVPKPVAGAGKALQRPASGRIKDTTYRSSEGSRLLVREAKRATLKRPLLVFVGGPCTTVATAYLQDPTIVDRVIVFQVDGGAYNAKDDWSWHITMQKFPFANWCRGYFWGDWSRWRPQAFDDLPKNPLCAAMRKYAQSDLGKANQWGDGAWIYDLFAPDCITKFEDYDRRAVTVPKSGTNTTAMQREFFTTMNHPSLFRPSEN